MVCSNEYYEYWKGYPPELEVLIGIACLTIIYGSIKAFACIKSEDRPRIVTILWLLADLTMIIGMISEVAWQPGGYRVQNWLAVYSF